jgi:hypothetical protein
MFLDLHFPPQTFKNDTVRAVKYEDNNRSISIKLEYLEPGTDYLTQQSLNSDLSYSFTFVTDRLVELESEELKISLKFDKVNMQ